MNAITILMSTYNGEKYLREQLDSIFAQKGVEIHVCVRDDGSTDKTTVILKEYIRNHPGKIELIEGRNIGWRKSFFELLQYASIHYAECDYFAFSDQDDIWLPDKLISATDALRTLPIGPALYHSNLYYYKNGVNYGKTIKKEIVPSIKKCLVRNYATGCTIVFNKELLHLCAGKIPAITVAHDYWMYQVAMLCGKVYYDDNAYILYRQHENNQIGCKSSKKDIWKRRLASVSAIFNDHRLETQSKELFRLFEENLSEEGRKAVTGMSNYRSSFSNRLKLLFDNGYTLDNRSNDFWMKLKILFGML